MLKKSQILAVTLIVSCTTPETKQRESNWGELGKAAEISCNHWPLRENELDVSQMLASSVAGGGFIATVRMRNGSRLPVFADGKKPVEIEMDELIALPVGRDANVIGLSEWDKEPVAFIVQNRNDRAWLEIRAVKNNKLVSRMPTPIKVMFTREKLQ
jgi:hypothetical protein